MRRQLMCGLATVAAVAVSAAGVAGASAYNWGKTSGWDYATVAYHS